MAMFAASNLTAPKTYVALAVFHAIDAVLCAIPIPQVRELVETLELPHVDLPRMGRVPTGWVLAAVKAAATAGLLSVFRFPALARLTTAMLTLYFTIAVAMHARTLSHSSALTRLIGVFAVLFWGACAAMTVKGPDLAESHR